MNWIIIGEFPPQLGGVADYTYQLAKSLVEVGHLVSVVHSGSGTMGREWAGVEEFLVGSFHKPHDLRRISKIVQRTRQPRIVLIQYVPQIFGLRGMNIVFAVWLKQLRERHVWVMFHEVKARYFGGDGAKKWLFAKVTTFMAKLVAGRATRCFIAIPAWRADIAEYVESDTEITWLPIPSNLPLHADPADQLRVRMMLGEGPYPTIGHFGTYGRVVTDILVPAIREIVRRRPDVRFIFIGRRSKEFLSKLEADGCISRGSAIASGMVPADQAAVWVTSADVMLQPYQDGVSSRRGTVMAALGLGRACVTNLGAWTESCWETSGAVVLAGGAEPERLAGLAISMLENPSDREAVGKRAAMFYQETFAITRTIKVLLQSATCSTKGR